MGYTGPYSLWRRCVSEFLAMGLTIFLGESLIANEVLTGTKGHEMGWGFVALGFGLAFYVPIQIFGVISAHINPAACIALWVIGELDAADFFALSASELAGAFVGAVFVWLLYLPHFSTAPTSPHDLNSNYLFQQNDKYTKKALKLVSYTPNPERQVKPKSLDKTLEQAKHFLERIPEHDEVDKFLDAYFENEQLPTQASLRRRTVQVADLQWEAAKEHFERLGHSVGDPLSADPSALTKSATDVFSRDHHALPKSRSDLFNGDQHALHSSPPASNHPTPHQASETVVVEAGKDRSVRSSQRGSQEMEEAMKAYHAARTADQNIKLGVFATRPAICNSLCNWIAEYLGTVALIFCALFFENSLSYVQPPLAGLADRGLAPLLIGMLVFVLVLALGGPTGYAANPARDMGPRLAHFVLPIVGKGHSEFMYSWIPFTAPLAGGATAGGLFLLITKLFIPPAA